MWTMLIKRRRQNFMRTSFVLLLLAVVLAANAQNNLKRETGQQTSGRLVAPVGSETNRLADDQLTTKQLRDSLRAASDLLAYHPDSLDLRLRKAAWNLLLEQWDYAKTEYDYVIARDPSNLAARYYRAFANEKLKRYNFARLDYERVLTVVPGNFNAQLGLALLNQRDSHFTEALDQINRMVEQFPDSAVVYAARGGMEKERGMKELAVYDYREAIKLDPQCVDYRVALTDLLISLKRRDDALAELDSLERMGVGAYALQQLRMRARKLK